MLTPSEIYRTFSPFIGTIKQGNIIYQDKKIYIQDTGTLIFDMDLGQTENIYFPTSVFNIILKTKSPSFKKNGDQLYVESLLANGKKKNLNFTYYKLDKNPIELPSQDSYEILHTFDINDIQSISQFSKFIQKESDSTYSGFFLSGLKKYFVAGSKTFSYISEVNQLYPALNLIKNFVFQSIEEGTVFLCRNKENFRFFYLITGDGFNCTLPVQQEKIYPASLLSKYELFSNKDNFYTIKFTYKDIKDAFKEITSDIGKNDILYLEFEIDKTNMIVKMQNKEKVLSKVEVNCTSEEKIFIKINSPEEKEILSAFSKIEGNNGIIDFMVPKHSALGKICVIDGEVKFVCTYNELRI